MGVCVKPFYFDNSMLCSFAECSAKGIAKHILYREGQNVGRYGDVGNAGHEALRSYLWNGNIEEALARATQYYEEHIGEDYVSEKELTLVNLIDHLEVWFESHPIDLLPFKVIEAERNVTVSLAPGFEFSMKRDVLAEDRQSGLLFPIDHKFRFGTITSWWTDKFKTNSQIAGYVWGTQKDKGVEKVSNQLIINVIALKALPTSNKRCAKHGVKFAECSKQHAESYFLRYERTDSQLAAWQKDALMLAKRALNFARGFPTVDLLKYAPREGAFSGGCTFCSLQKWCRADFNPDLMETLTTRHKWAPWEEIPF